MNAVLQEIAMGGDETNLERRVVAVEIDMRRHDRRFEKIIERSDRQFEAMRQEFLAEIKALRVEFFGGSKAIHSEFTSIHEAIASLRLWGLTFGFGLAAGILSLMAKEFGWLH